MFKNGVAGGTLNVSARSSVDRASVFGTEGRGFESLRAGQAICVRAGNMGNRLFRTHRLHLEGSEGIL